MSGDLRADIDALVDNHLADDGLVAADLLAAQSTIADQARQIVRLQAELDALTTPFGVNFDGDGGTGEASAKVARVFLQKLDGVTWSSITRVKRATALGITTFVISWRDRDAAHVKAFLATIPDGVTVYACFNHEPEDDAGVPGSPAYVAWSKEWKRLWTVQAPLIEAAGCIPTQILMGWTLDAASKRDIADWTAPAGTVKVALFDAYLNHSTPELQTQRIAAYAAATGLRVGIAETGSVVTDKARPVKLAKLRALVLTSVVPYVCVCYWDATDGPDADFRFDPPALASFYGVAA